MKDLWRTEKHIFVNDKNLDNLCWLSKNLYNYCNYIIRQIYTNKFDNISEYKHLIKSFVYNEKVYYIIKEYDLIKELTKQNQVDYRMLPPQTSQQIIKELYVNWKSFNKSMKEYVVNSNKFRGKPKMPNYKKKNGRSAVIFTNQQARLHNGFITFPKKVNLKSLRTKVSNICQVRILPQATCNVIEVVYKKEVIEHELDNNLYVGIDLGVNNLATLTSNKQGMIPLLINGRSLKSINQYFNKKLAKLHSFVGNKGTSNRIRKLIHKRNNKVFTYLHKTSRIIIDYCVENQIGIIVIGYNKEWKIEVNLGKANNQNFVGIPFNTLVKQIEYKAEENGIKTVRQEESYTSKCDFLANEDICNHNKYKGKRIKRGLFKSFIGKTINADVNGSLNIIKKAFPESFANGIEGIEYCPIKVNTFIKEI